MLDDVEVGQLREVGVALHPDQTSGLAGLKQADTVELLLHLGATVLERGKGGL